MPNKVRVVWKHRGQPQRFGQNALAYVQSMSGRFWAYPEVRGLTPRWTKAMKVMRLMRAQGVNPGGTLAIYREPRRLRMSRSAYKQALQAVGLGRPIPTQRQAAPPERLTREVFLREWGNYVAAQGAAASLRDTTQQAAESNPTFSLEELIPRRAISWGRDNMSGAFVAVEPDEASAVNIVQGVNPSR